MDLNNLNSNTASNQAASQAKSSTCKTKKSKSYNVFRPDVPVSTLSTDRYGGTSKKQRVKSKRRCSKWLKKQAKLQAALKQALVKTQAASQTLAETAKTLNTPAAEPKVPVKLPENEMQPAKAPEPPKTPDTAKEADKKATDPAKTTDTPKEADKKTTPDNLMTVGADKKCNTSTKTPVAANERATVWGDPHIEGADRPKQPGQWYGVSYDIQEAGIFNLLTDKNLTINSEFEKGPNNTTLASKVGIDMAGTKISYCKEKGLTVDGNPVAEGKSMILPNGTSVTQIASDWSGQPAVRITHPNSEFDIHVQVGVWGAGKYLNIAAESKKDGVMTDGTAPEGILGETFDADTLDQTGLKKPLETYKRTALVP